MLEQPWGHVEATRFKSETPERESKVATLCLTVFNYFDTLEIVKICPKCYQEKAVSEFPKSLRTKSGIYPYCKSCCVKRSGEWRKSNPETYDAAKKRRVQRLREKAWEYLRTHPCVDCGCTDIRALQFDHIKDKKNHVSSMIGHGLSWKQIEEEIKKCEIRCANCHIIKTGQQLKWYSYSLSGGVL